MRTVQASLACVLTVGPLAPGSALAADEWFLLARHGECFPVRSLERKFPDIGNIAAPEAFVKFVLAKGLNASSKVVPVRAGSAREVLVPERELSLVFVTRELCPQAGAMQPGQNTK